MAIDVHAVKAAGGAAGLVELVAEMTSAGLVVTTGDDRVVWANAALAALVGSAGDAPLDAARALLPDLAVARGARDHEAAWPHPDGTRRLEIRSRPLPGPGDLFLSEVTDVTDRHRREEEAARRERRFARLEALALVGTWEWDLDTDAVTWSEDMLRAFGHAPGTVLDYHGYRSMLHVEDVVPLERTLAEALETGRSFSVTYRMFMADGVTERVFEAHGEVVHDPSGRPVRVLGTVHDITEQRRVQAELAYLAERDSLTSLPNQRALRTQLRERYDRGAPTGALLLVGVDAFKRLNDGHGTAAGDAVLRALPAVLLEHATAGATLARKGGDEFAVLVREGDPGDALAIARAVCRAVERRPVAAGGAVISVRVSVGVAPLARAEDAGALLTDAERALRRAKAAGGNRAELADPAQRDPMGGRPPVHERVNAALASGALTLDAQPIVDLASGSVASYELLLRLRDGQDPPLAPEDFLVPVERCDLMLRIDRWVVEQAVAALASPGGRARGLRLDVNTSVRSLADPSFADHIVRTLRAADIAPSRLGLEITETAAITSPDTARHLADQLSRAGCRFVLDDFSAGLGSFVHLKHLPFTAVKIASTFLRQAEWTVGDTVLVESVVQAARGLGMRTIAKHVERSSVVDRLQRLGVHRAQGFHLGAPTPLPALVRPVG